MSDQGLPRDLGLVPKRRWPTTLDDETVRTVLNWPIPRVMPSSLKSHEPDVSVVVVVRNGLVFTRLCIESLLANTMAPSYQVIVIDNASNDGTTEYLQALTARVSSVEVVYNRKNRGFPAAVNQGLAKAEGQTLVVLNNDTLLPPNWLVLLTSHVNDASVGLVGPVTNHAPNEAAIPARYRTYGEFLDFARGRADDQARRQRDVRTLTMFCIAIPRGVYEAVGGLDERFDLGLFEDDDYAMRVRQAGWRVVCAEDAYVHHFGEAAFGFAPSGTYAQLFERNRRQFEEKWGTSWEPHKRRADQEYDRLVADIQETVDNIVPGDSIVLVVSKGDDELIRFRNCKGWHFPQLLDGSFAGHYPVDSGEAITHLELLREMGAAALVIPNSAFWWLDFYREFARHLNQRYQTLHRDDDCLVFRLTA